MVNIELKNKDCFDYLASVRDKSVNLFLIDPPYNISKDKWDKFPSDKEYADFMGKIFKEANRVLKDNGTLLWFHSDINKYLPLFEECKKQKFALISQVIITKNNFRTKNWKNLSKENNLRSWFNVNEFCFHYVKSDLITSDKTGLNTILHDKNNFKNLRDYAEAVNKKLFTKYSRTKLKEIFGNNSMQHFFEYTGPQFALPTEKNYLRFLEVFNLIIGQELINGHSVRDYNDLRQEYNEVRGELEQQRYVFNTGLIPEYKNVFNLTGTMNQNNKIKTAHKTQKNLDIIKNLIYTHSHAGDTVLDCFAGSGTTLFAALETKRHFTGCELNEDYIKEIKNNIEKHYNNYSFVSV